MKTPEETKLAAGKQGVDFSGGVRAAFGAMSQRHGASRRILARFPGKHEAPEQHTHDKARKESNRTTH